MRTLKIAMLGFGNAGRAFAKILEEKREEIRKRCQCDPVVTVITTKSRGSLVSKNGGLDLRQAWTELETLGHFDEASPEYSELTSMEAVETADYDVVLELTPLEIFSGEPAATHLRKAMERGKHAITANKGPIAWAFHELSTLAERQGVCFFYETTVMDGTPIFNLVEETLPLCRVTEVNGILNTTTNFILEELAKGVEYDQVIAEGKRRGFVEADPSMDVDGWDAAAKTTALLNVLMNAQMTPDQIGRTGIAGIGRAEIEAAASRGKVIKLMCHGGIEAGEVVGTVKPVEVDKGSFWASVDGTTSVVQISTDLMGTLSVVEHNPEIEQTGYGVFSDLLRLIHKTPLK